MKSRSNFKVKVKVTRSKITVSCIRFCHKKYTYESSLGKTSRSRSLGKKCWYHVKGIVTRNTHVQYESSITSGKKVMAKVKVFVHAHTLDIRPCSLKSIIHWVRSYHKDTHVKYERPYSFGSKVIASVKCFWIRVIRRQRRSLGGNHH